MNDLVSIVITTYRRPNRLKIAIESVLAQSYKNIEIIVVDDNGDNNDYRENTQKIMNYYEVDSRIKYIKHKTNKKIGAARNTGILNSKSQYIAFFDDDDIWYENKIECQMDLFYRDSEVGLVYCSVNVYDDKQQKIISTINAKCKGYIKDKILYSNFIPTTSSIIVKKEWLLKVDNFDEQLYTLQDWDLYIKLSSGCKFDYCKQPLMSFVHHDSDEGERITKNFELKEDFFYLYIERLKLYLNSYNNFVRFKSLSEYYYRGGIMYVSFNKKEYANKMFFKSVKIWPFNYKNYIYLFSYNLLSINMVNFLKKTKRNFSKR